MLKRAGKSLVGILLGSALLFSSSNKTHCEDKIQSVIDSSKIVQVDSTKNKEKEKPSRRNLNINEVFILTDKTKANTFKITSKKEWDNYKDEVLISWDILGQENETGRFYFKKQRVDFGYKLYTNTKDNSSKTPFFEYVYSSDKPTKIKWKVLIGGIAQKLWDWQFSVGGGYFWGGKENIDKYNKENKDKNYVVALDLSNEKKISNLTLKQNLKNILPQGETQPIYDYKSSLSIPFTKKFNGAINFDWRYQQTPKLKKEDWFNYSLKFGLTFVPRK